MTIWYYEKIVQTDERVKSRRDEHNDQQKESVSDRIEQMTPKAKEKRPRTDAS